MELDSTLIVLVLLALLVAGMVSFLTTPVVKTFAYKVGAIDVPKDARRMHKVPIPRLGGLAIFIGFMVSILLFVPVTPEMKSILLGAVIIVVLGVVDEMCIRDRSYGDGAVFRIHVQLVSDIFLHGWSQ